MGQRWGNFVSYLFHPAFVPLALCGLFFTLPTNLQPTGLPYLYLIVLGVGTLILPLISLGLFRWAGLISSIHMPSSRERRWPLILFALSYYSSRVVLLRLGLDGPMEALLLAGCFCMITFSILSPWTKPSLHAAAMGAALGFVVYLYVAGLVHSVLWPFYILLLGATVASARLVLQAHSPAQLLTGWLTGLIASLLCLFLYA